VGEHRTFDLRASGADARAPHLLACRVQCLLAEHIQEDELMEARHPRLLLLSLLVFASSIALLVAGYR